MSNAELAAQIALATRECVLSIIPLYFVLAKIILFVLAFAFSIVLVGILLAGKLLLFAVQMVSRCQRTHKFLGVAL